MWKNKGIGQVSHLLREGSSAPRLPGYVQNTDRIRTLSIRSSSSEDRGYSSGDVYSTSENLAVISEGEQKKGRAKLGFSNRMKNGSTSDLVI